MEDFEQIRLERFGDALRGVRERMIQDLDSGVSRDRVAMTEEQFRDATGGAGQYDYLFNEAFASFCKTWLQSGQYENSRGMVETRYTPNN